MQPSEEFAGLLEELVRRHGGIQKAAAAAIGIEDSTLGRWRRRVTIPTPESCILLARELELTVGDVLVAAYGLSRDQMAPGPAREFENVVDGDPTLTVEAREALHAVYRLARHRVS